MNRATFHRLYGAGRIIFIWNKFVLEVRIPFMH